MFDELGSKGSMGFNSGQCSVRCIRDPMFTCETPQTCTNASMCYRHDPNVFELPADAVREVKEAPLLDAPKED